MKRKTFLDFSRRTLLCALCVLSSAGIVAGPVSGGSLPTVDAVQW